MPTAWDLLLREARAGLRRYVGTQAGDRIQGILAHLGEGDYTDPEPYERTLGDYLDPTRPGRFMDLVNVTTRETGLETADWGVARIFSMVAAIQNDPQPDVPE